jgi:glucan biosynthesis protein C
LDNNTQLNRRNDLDWIRVLATFLVILYHCSMFFNPFPWHVKNNELNSTYIYAYTLLVGNWMMPIFFAVSGISAFYALRKRSASSFLKERLLRIGLPLLFGVFILTPPQVYMERVSHKQFTGSLWQFLPHYFNGVYLEIGGQGNFAFFGLHLWFLFVLLIFSFIAMPLFVRKRGASLQKPFDVPKLMLLLLPLLIIGTVLNGIANLGGWGLFFYLAIFLYGYFAFSDLNFIVFVRKTGMWTGAISLISTVIFMGWSLGFGIPQNGTIPSLLFSLLRVVNVWFSLFYIFYLADRYLRGSNRFLQYTSEASMPLYVIHQPVIVSLGFLIYTLDWSVSLKLFFLVLTACLVILFLYHVIIKRLDVFRVLFGMKKSKRTERTSIRISA